MGFAVIVLSLTVVASAQLADQEPQLKSLPKLETRPASERHLFGTKMTVNVSVDAKGNVTAVNSVDGPGWVCPGVVTPEITVLRSAAEAVAKKAKFVPAVVRGEKSASTTLLDIEFPATAKALPMRQRDDSDSTLTGTTEVKDTVKTGSEDEVVTQRSTEPTSNASAERVGTVSGLGGLGANQSGTALISNARVKDGDTVSGGILNGKAGSLPRPAYPAAARAVRASGAVHVQVIISEEGMIWSAMPVSGHPLLRNSARLASCGSKFGPTTLSGRPVKVSGVITYNFVP